MTRFEQIRPNDEWEEDWDDPGIISLRPPRHTTGELPDDHDQQCPYCEQYYCDSCGDCHTAGCARASVVCADAQASIMYRNAESIPDDMPVSLPGYSEGPDIDTLIGFIGIVLALLVVGWIVLHVFLHAF